MSQKKGNKNIFLDNKNVWDKTICDNNFFDKNIYWDKYNFGTNTCMIFLQKYFIGQKYFLTNIFFGQNKNYDKKVILDPEK